MSACAHIINAVRAATIAALSVLCAQSAGATTGEFPAVQDRTLIRHAELCRATDGITTDDLVGTFRQAGFVRVDSVRPDLEAFFETRQKSFRARGQTNEAALQTADAHLKESVGILPIAFRGADDWVALVRSDTPLALVNDVPIGNGHLCIFFGYGWTTELQAEAERATLAGEDFIGRGSTVPGDDWRYFFSGQERGEEPKAQCGIWAVKGAKGTIQPTISLEWTVVHDMTIPPWVLSKQ